MNTIWSKPGCVRPVSALEFQKRNFYILQGEDGAQGRAGIQGSQGSLVSCRRSQHSN